MTQDVQSLRARIEAMQSELKDLERKERQERDAKLKAFKRKWRFTLTAELTYHWDRIYDDTLVWYTLRGELLNAAEYKAIGGDPDRKQGSMRYLYNTLTKRLVMRASGGHLYVKGESIGDNDVVSPVYAEMAKAIANGVQDITSLIVNQDGFSW